ncbi:non-homologous end-joining DNA ligase [Actinopolymorpha pittospori]|uniref:DNA ligase (ATP) n=1 Tax=Actinopolymorpha pittospori TaxID=648752 RepID=A0A927RFW4_9ACTN|nr:non-homologous end-joining DNA ligase [Actinopolymorpha pittospori]MBE1610575.1 bifunctional non-homologous end joining protein LigD [Actinopolymorpha pittospori]
MTDVLGLPHIAPMLATAGRMPAEREQDRWSFEMKWDGVRAVAYVASGEVVLLGRSGRDFTRTYPEVSAVGAALPGRPCVLDGEVVALDEQGRPSFELLQSRMHGLGAGRGRRRPPGREPVAPPGVVYLVFDVLHLDGVSLLREPYAARRQTLEGLGLAGPQYQVPPAFEGSGEAALRTSAAQLLEGVVAKRLDSSYEPGRRAGTWLKVKHLRTQDVVLGGWRVGEGSRAGTFGALLCGVYEGGRLRYAGRVGTGFTQERLVELMARLAPLEQPVSAFDEPLPRPDARGAHWVRPVLVGEVAFTEWTREGRLRNPAWRGLRADRDPAEVTREP